MRALPLPTNRNVGLVVAAVFAAALALVLALGPATASQAAGHSSHGSNASSVNSAKDGLRGTTGGWYDGRDVKFIYNKPFYCDTTVASGAESGCTLGAEPQVPPRGGDVPVLYVMVPLTAEAASAAGGTLQCPVAGDCINHPSTIDLSAAFGPDAANAALPPHSHIVDVKHGGWWELEVVGVTTAEAWDAIDAGKDLDTVRELQADGGGVTGDLPTNSFLFFNVAG